MSYETKQLAEKLIKLHNSTEILNEIVSVLQSSENTVKEDVIALKRGAILEPQFDIDKMSDMANDLRSDISNAEEYADSARGCLDDIDSCVSGALSYADDLCSMMDDVKYELKKDDETEEGSNE
jgi:hypothetical protein